jgi:subtilisin family serine protease
VGSTTKQNTTSSFSNSSGLVSLLAPGTAIASSVPGAAYSTASGTSMATPHVAGAWAVLKSAKPTATVAEILSALQNTGVPITDTRNGVVKSLIQIGNSTTSVGALGSLSGNAPPTVSLTSPTNNATLTAPATVSLSATAADSGGSVSKVEFYRDGALIATVTSPASGTPSSGTYAYNDTNVAVGNYSYTAKAYDNTNAVTTSSAVLVSVTATSAASVNVAAQANGGVATASSSTSPYLPAAANNGDRKGLNLAAGGVWADSSANSFPDWLQISFSNTQSIGEIDVFSVQDNYAAPLDPTPSMTFTQYGLTDFQVQYWNGSAWLDVPQGNVTGNNSVWRRFTFTAITTNAIRLLVNSALSGYSRVAEVEAWGASGEP